MEEESLFLRLVVVARNKIEGTASRWRKKQQDVKKKQRQHL